MSILKPDAFETLSKEIGTRFDFYALDLILFKMTGDHIIHAIAAERDPRWQIARACLEQAEKDGTTVQLLNFALTAHVTDDGFRDIVTALVPQTANFQPEIKLAVAGIVSGLDGTLGQLADPAIRSAIAGSSVKLADIRRKVIALGVYKLFHDSLHRLQMRRFASLRDAASALKPDSVVPDTLLNFQDQIRASLAVVSRELLRLPVDDEDRAEQGLWIGRLQAAATDLQTAIDQGDRDLARRSLQAVKRILDTQPTAINGRIFSIAETLGLSDLVLTLERVADVAHETEKERIAAGAETLKNLSIVLIGRVREHRLWQEVDDDLEPFEPYFGLKLQELLTDFPPDWTSVKGKFPTLWGHDPDSRWATQLRRYQRNIDDELTRLEGMLGQSTDGDAAAWPADRLVQQFGNFKAEARLQFFVVDTTLKIDCEALLAIDPALGAIVKRLNNG
jgi:hypothetical protein